MTWPSLAPNSDHARQLVQAAGLPAPAYVEGRNHEHATQWAKVVVEWASDRFGGDNAWYPYGDYVEECDCGVTWVGDQPCWNCDPQAPPALILPVSASDRRW